MTAAEFQALLDQAAGKMPRKTPWVRFDYVEVRTGEIITAAPLVIDGGPYTNLQGDEFITRGPGPSLNLRGTVIKADPAEDWTGKCVMEWCGASVIIDGLNMDTSGCSRPPMHHLAGGLVETANGGHSYTGGGSVIRDAFLTGPAEGSSILLNNAEMVTIINPNIRNKADAGDGILIARGWPGAQYASRITPNGHTQTLVTIHGGDIQAQGQGAAIASQGDVAQIMVEGSHLGTDEGPMYHHRGNDQAKNVVFLANRFETHAALGATLWDVAPDGCQLAYNGLHRHGWPKPAAMWEIVCPDIIRAANIRTEGNTTSAGRLIKHRTTWPDAVPV